MAEKKRGLGRGLEALFGDEEKFPIRQSVPESAVGGTVRRLAGIDQLQPGKFQPRQTIDETQLSELAASIAEHGILQPLLVRALTEDGDRFEIIAGERRWRAAQAAKLHEVPVIIRAMSDAQALEIGLIENLQRADLDALEEALGFQRLSHEFGHTQEQLATKLGKSRSYIANSLRLLTLPAPIQALLRQGKLTPGHARALVGLPNAEQLAHEIIAKGLSVRETERRAKQAVNPPANDRAGNKAGAAQKDVDTLALEKDLSAKLGLGVTIDVKKEGGTLSIAYRTLDQLDGILRRLND